MSRRRARPGRQRIQPSAEAQAALRGDHVAAVKTRLLLLQRGGKAIRQVCIFCHRRGKYQEVWIPAALLSPVPGDARAQHYWTCAVHHADPLPDEELVKRLASGAEYLNVSKEMIHRVHAASPHST
jgi:hypothetical protein